MKIRIALIALLAIAVVALFALFPRQPLRNNLVHTPNLLESSFTNLSLKNAQWESKTPLDRAMLGDLLKIIEKNYSNNSHLDSEITACTPTEDERMRRFSLKFTPQSQILEPLDEILAGGLELRFGRSDFIKSEKNYDDFDRFFPKSIPRLLRILLLSAHAECRKGNCDTACDNLSRAWAVQEGLVDTPLVALIILGGIKGRREFIQIALHDLPILPTKLLDDLANRLRERSDVAEALAISVAFNLIGTENSIRNSMPFQDRSFISSMLSEPGRFWPLLKLHREMKRERLIYLDRMISLMNELQINPDSDNPTTDLVKKRHEPSRFFNDQIRTNYLWNLEEHQENEELIITLIQAIDSEIEMRRNNSKMAFEIPVSEYRKIVIGSDRGCFEPPY